MRTYVEEAAATISIMCGGRGHHWKIHARGTSISIGQHDDHVSFGLMGWIGGICIFIVCVSLLFFLAADVHELLCGPARAYDSTFLHDEE